MKYSGKWTNGEISMPVSFEIAEETVSNVQPPALSNQLTGACFLAHQNYRNLLRGEVNRLPSNVEAWPIESPGIQAA